MVERSWSVRLKVTSSIEAVEVVTFTSERSINGIAPSVVAMTERVLVWGTTSRMSGFWSDDCRMLKSFVGCCRWSST